MGLRVSTNLASINAQRQLSGSQRAIEKSYAQLASGSRITKAADDAAGLSISEGLKSSIRGYRQAQRNANDGISLVQVAEGGLNEIGNILVRLRELGVQASSDTIGDTERGFLDKEVQNMKMELERISKSTRFGSVNLLDGSGEQFAFQVDIGNDDVKDRIVFDAGKTDAGLSALSLDDLDMSTKDGARESLALVDSAQTTVAGYRADLGATQSRLISTSDYLGIAVEGLSAANSRIRDTDVAESSAEMVRNSILLGASTSVLAQANTAPQVAVKLIS